MNAMKWMRKKIQVDFVAIFWEFCYPMCTNARLHTLPGRLYEKTVPVGCGGVLVSTGNDGKSDAGGEQTPKTCKKINCEERKF